MLPAIYTLVGCPTIGELGDASKVRHFPVCPVCRKRRRPEFEFIEYCFDRWAGEDLVYAMGCYVVSERLRYAFEASGITGLVYQDMVVSKGDDFEIIAPAYSEELPPFHRLVIEGIAKGPEIWWNSWTCKVCGVKHWERTEDGTHAEMAYITGDIGIPREVFQDLWQGDDIFRLCDPGPPIVTQRFVEVIKNLDCVGVVLHPAKWTART